MFKTNNDDDEYYKVINHPDDLLRTINDHGVVKKGEKPLYNLVIREDKLTVFVFIN
jgi:hypothetical protein